MDTQEKKLNEWFLKNEGISYKEFCNIYNNGKPYYISPIFLKIPEELLETSSIIFKYFPGELKRLYEFLHRNNALESFIRGIESSSKWMESVSYRKTQRNLEDIISHAFTWSVTPNNSQYNWAELSSMFNQENRRYQ